MQKHAPSDMMWVPSLYPCSKGEPVSIGASGQPQPTAMLPCSAPTSMPFLRACKCLCVYH